jgi:hypothetical protein
MSSGTDCSADEPIGPNLASYEPIEKTSPAPIHTTRPAAPAIDAETESALKAKILQLSDTIRQKDSKLCFEELARSMAELKLASSDLSMWKRLNEQSKALEEARLRIIQLQQQGGTSEADELRLRIADLEDDVRRRDEQIDFLMHVRSSNRVRCTARFDPVTLAEALQVHDAAHDSEWVQKWAYARPCR